MTTRVVNLRRKEENSQIDEVCIKGLEQLQQNKTYRILATVRDKPMIRSRIEKRFRKSYWAVGKLIEKGYLKKDLKNCKYYITENGLDKIDLLKIQYGVYQG